MVCNSTKGESMKKMKTKQKRLTLLKSIAQEPTIRGKLCVAMGRSFFGDFAAESELNLLNLIGVAKSFNQKRDFTDKRFQETVKQIGLMALDAITSGNHIFFSRLAAKIQHNKKPSIDKMYSDILQFCYLSRCGTAEKPCDAKKLRGHLGENGHTFSGDHAKQFPRRLKILCQNLGIVLGASQGRGRPRKNS
jgi:hypothetical protein